MFQVEHETDSASSLPQNADSSPASPYRQKRFPPDTMRSPVETSNY